MMFFNIVLCDLRNGILKRWRVFLASGFLFVVLAVLAYLDFEAALRMDPSPVTSAVSLGDYLCYLFGGTSDGNRPIEFFDQQNIVNSMFEFSFPSVWCLIYLVLLLITLQYPYEDLMGFGKHIILLSNKIHYWWMSKFIWIAATTVTYFAISIAFFSATALLLGAECNLHIGTYYPYFRFTAVDFLKDPPWNIVPTLSMVIPVGIGLCAIQLALSLITTRLWGYLIGSAFLLGSAYMQHELLFPNASMFARSLEVVTNGQVVTIELIVIAWFTFTSILAGYLYLKRADILNKHK